MRFFYQQMALSWSFVNDISLSSVYSSFDGSCCSCGGVSFCESAVFYSDGSSCGGAVFDGGICFGGTTLDGGGCCCGSDSSK